MPRIRIGRVWVDELSFAAAIDAIEALFGNGGVVFTPNVDHVVRAERSEEFRAAYDAADLSLADGQWLVWAAKVVGTPLPAKISGSDLTLPLVKRAAERGQSIYLLGGAPGAAEGAARVFEKECGARIAGVDSPRINLDQPDPTIVERVKKAAPGIVLVALGSPKQELWIHRNREALRPAVLVGIGATFEFLSGQVKRAPKWISKLGLEWIFRLMMEPRRLARRYLIEDPKFAAIVVRTAREPRERRVTLVR
jgi:N-acetylglucosaminyldiphosphoundecaprenol N-acetyl-beta-D-mannosaminyltransferase